MIGKIKKTYGQSLSVICAAMVGACAMRLFDLAQVNGSVSAHDMMYYGSYLGLFSLLTGYFLLLTSVVHRKEQPD